MSRAGVWGMTRAEREERARADEVTWLTSALQKPHFTLSTLWDMKMCPRCKVEKLLSEFKSDKLGRFSWCRNCARDYTREQRKKHPQQPGSRRGSHLPRMYGITKHQYDLLFAAQTGVCRICGQAEQASQRKDGLPSALAVDHDHETGEVRGLLCSRCNIGLGYFLHDAARLRGAIRYLETTTKPLQRPAQTSVCDQFTQYVVTPEITRAQATFTND